MIEPRTAEEIVVETLRILQRELPGGDLSAREAIAELWGLVESPEAQAIIARLAPSEPSTPKG
jgi:hypothetical protein